jgi:hypothetical protein
MLQALDVLAGNAHMGDVKGSPGGTLGYGYGI